MRGLVAAILLTIAAAAAWPGGGRAVFLARISLPAGTAEWRGLSAIEVDGTGIHFTALTDQGFVLTGRLQRRDGRLAGLADPARWPLPGRPDSEGLALAPGGRLYISTEGPARVLAFDAGGPAPDQPPVAGAWRDLPENAALEALAIDAAGRLLTLPEGPRLGARPFPLWRLEGGHWRRLMSLPRRGPFLPVGADMGPDDRLYVLERAFFGPFGFRSRVRRIDLSGSGGPTVETVLTTPLWRFGNLEGLAVWRAGPGEIRLLMVRDDDFGGRPDFVEFALRDALVPMAARR